MCDTEYSDGRYCQGYAEWEINEVTSQIDCTIYMPPRETFLYQEGYLGLLGHEFKHCVDGDWHE